MDIMLLDLFGLVMPYAIQALHQIMVQEMVYSLGVAKPLPKPVLPFVNLV